MLIVHLLGHAYVTQDRRTVPISAKATALIAYLALEKLPQHRERLAELLWDTPEARKNLRVELARIRSAGLNIFPSSHQLLYLEHVQSDFDGWCAQAGQDMNQRQLTDWLTLLRGLPFTGLEDMGSLTFQSWVDQQRWLMAQQVEQQLSRVYWRYLRDGHTWATRLIAERAEALGLENPAEVAQASGAPEVSPGTEVQVPTPPFRAAEEAAAPRPRIGAVHFERPHEERELLQVFRRAEERPQLVVLHGPPGSGKNYLTDRLAQQLDWLVLRVSGLRSGRLVLASLAQALLGVCDPGDAEALGRMLLQPGSLDEDMVKVAFTLSRVRRPALLVFDQAQEASPELAPLLGFLFEASRDRHRVFLLLSREAAAHVPLARALRRRTEPATLLDLALPPLTSVSVQRTLEAQFPFEPVRRLQALATRLLQRSEGNPLHLLSLLSQTPDLDHLNELHFPQAVRDTFDREIDHWPPALREALSCLSVIYGRFDLALLRAALDDAGRTADTRLYEALAHRALVEADPEVPLRWPQLTPADGSAPVSSQYVFQNEGLRVALLSRLPQFLRREVRARLAQALADSSPGLAAYYAARAGQPEEAARLRERQRQRLPEGSPLRDLPLPLPERPPLPLVLPEIPAVAATTETLATHPQSRQGYLLLRDQGGLTVLTGRYGPPSTLSIQFQLPSGAAAARLQLLWRLDVYSGGEELGPEQIPFPLRLRRLDTDTAHVLTPRLISEYQESGLRHIAHTGVGLGVWMDHLLRFPAAGGPPAEPQVLELSVRAVDVALTLAALRWNGQDLLAGPAVPQVRPLPRR